MPVNEKKEVISEDQLANALAVEPGNLKEGIGQWRTLKDHISEVKASINDHEDKVKYLENFISGHLTVPDDGTKSETISVPGAGSVYKEQLVGATVLDWEKWRNYLNRNGFGAVARQQNNIAPLQDLYDLIMAGDLPMPQSVEFGTYTKLRMRRN